MPELNKIEAYLIDLKLNYLELAPNSWLINDDSRGLEETVVISEPPLAIIRVKVMEIPVSNREEFFEKLLRFNATDIVHGAYGLEGNDVILIDTLQYDTLSKEELQASLDAVGLALSQHYPVLSKYRTK
jgi:hypothetical protein